MKKYKGEIGLLIVAIIWGTGFVASSISLKYMSPYQALFIRFLVGAIFLPILFYKKLKNINKTTLIRGFILGFFLYTAFNLQTVGLKYTTPSKNAFLTAVNVVIVPFIGFVLYKRKIDKYGLFGAIIAIMGIGILSLQNDFSVGFGDLLTLFCAVLFALHIFFTGEFLKRGEDPIHLAIFQMVSAWIFSFVIVLLNGEFTSIFSIKLEGYLSVLYLGFFSTTLAFLLQSISQKYVNETKAAIILSTESVFGSLFSVTFLHEEVTLRMIIGCILILLAILIAEVKPDFKKYKIKGNR